MKISAAVAHGVRQDFSIEPVELSMPRSDEVLVRMRAAGICHTDMAMRDHKIYPIPHPCVLGHEGAGIVEKVGSAVTKVKPGDHVALSFSSCGTCPSCVDNAPSYCSSFDALNFEGGRSDHSTPLSADGDTVHTFMGQSSFATHAVVAERGLVKVELDIPFEIAGPMGCAVLTGAGAVLNVLRVRPGDSIGIFGTGSVGMCALMAAHLAGAATIVAVDINQNRLQQARALGATHVLNANEVNVKSEIISITGGRGLDFTFDNTGNMGVLAGALQVLARRGTCGFVGGAPKGITLELDVEHLMTGGRTLRGIILGDCNPDTFIPKMTDLYRAGKFPLDRIVTTYPFADINKAVSDVLGGSTIKAVLQFPS